jgi:hypothetical protein
MQFVFFRTIHIQQDDSRWSATKSLRENKSGFRASTSSGESETTDFPSITFLDIMHDAICIL